MWALKLHRAAGWANGLVGLSALVGFIGWIGNWPQLTAMGADSPAILPGSVVVLTLLSVALWALRAHERATEGRRLRWEVGAASAGIAFVAMLALGLNLGVLNRKDPAFGSIEALFDPAPTSVGTACCYLLLAGAMMLATLDRRRAGEWSQFLALAVAGVVGVALVGLTFRFVRLDLAVPSLGMALPVAIALLAASFGVLAVRPSPRLLQLLERDSPGALIVRRLLPVAVGLPLLAGWLQILGLRAGWFESSESEGVLTVAVILAGIGLLLWLSAKLDEMNRFRARAEGRAATQRQWLEVTLANIGDAVLTVNSERRVSFLNPAAETLLGIRRRSALGRPIDELLALVDEATQAPVDGPLKAAFGQKCQVSVDGEAALRHPDGRLQAVEVTASPIVDAGGRLKGGVMVLRDAGIQRAREHAQREAYAALDRRVAERTQALEQTMSALRESTALLRAIAASTPELIVATSCDGRIMMVNPAALEAMALDQAQVVGRREEELCGESEELGEERREELRRAAEDDRRVIDSGEPLVVEEVRRTRNGPRTYQTTKSPLRDPQGQIFGVVGVARDITQLKETQQKLESLLVAEHRLRAEAERANRAKDEFLAIVSHELRSPLNALKGWSQILAGAGEHDAALIGRAAEAIKRNIDHQTRLIDDLLDTARIISGKLDLNLQRIDIGDVIDTALANARELARAKRIELRFIAGAEEVMIDGDFDRLQQVLNNLLSNAIKFTPEGGRVEIGLLHEPDEVELSVTDNGIGIEADFLPHVFDRFSQADTSLTRRYFGLGIGLALVRNLVELHGGSVGVVSGGAGQGARFTVTLPRRQPRTAGRNGGKAGPSAEKALDGIAIVIADDDPDAREVMHMMLSRAGARVRSFDSGEQLLAGWRTAALSPKPDVLLLDIAMPGDSGFEVLQQIRALEDGRRIPAIAVTALTQLDAQRFAEAGFDGRVGKPVDERVLVETIVAVLGAGGQRAGTPPAGM